MANHKSAVKAHRQNVNVRGHNRELRTRLRHALKAARAAIDPTAGTESGRIGNLNPQSVVAKK